jgi:hypothetical protein
MFAIALFIATPILLAIALAVRFAGNEKILNIVDYSRVSNIARLHRWADNRLLLLPLFCIVWCIVTLPTDVVDPVHRVICGVSS